MLNNFSAILITMEHLKSQGRTAFGEKNYKAAAEIYTKALELDPSDPILYSNRAQCFLNLSLWTQALNDCDNGLRRSPEGNIKEKLLFRKALAAKGTKNYESAVASLNQLLELSPSNGTAKFELEQINSILREPGEASAKKLKVSSGSDKIPLEIVDKLPEKFAKILQPERQDSVPAPGDHDLVDKVSQELFLDRPKKSTPSPQIRFAERPAMLKLKMLDHLPLELRSKAFKPVLELSSQDLRDLGDVEPEFFELFLDSSAYGLAHKTLSGAELIEKLTVLRSLARFGIALHMCSTAKISDLLKQVETSLPASLRSIADLLS